MTQEQEAIVLEGVADEEKSISAGIKALTDQVAELKSALADAGDTVNPRLSAAVANVAALTNALAAQAPAPAEPAPAPAPEPAPAAEAPAAPVVEAPAPEAPAEPAA